MLGRTSSRTGPDVGGTRGEVDSDQGAERRLTLHPCEVIDLTNDSDDVMLDSSGSSESIRDFAREEQEQAHNEEGKTIEAEVCRAMVDPAPESLPPYQDPPGIDDPFMSE